MTIEARPDVPRGSILSALAKAIHEMTDPVKNAKNPHFRSNYADLNSVLECIREPLSANGLVVIQRPYIEPDGKRVLVTELWHAESGDMMDLGTVELVMDKQTAQAQGSAITYARRYGLQTAFGLSAVDDDGNAASGRSGPPQRTQARAPVKRTDTGPGFDLPDLARAAIEVAKDADELQRIGQRIGVSGFTGEDRAMLSTAYNTRVNQLKEQ